MFYVLLVWLLAGVVVVTAEFAIYSFLPPGFDVLGALTAPEDLTRDAVTHQIQSGLQWNLGLMVALLAFSLGFVIETIVRPIKHLYAYLQQTYPDFYRRWAADWRELKLAWAVSLLSGGILATVWFFVQWGDWGLWGLGWLAFALGLSLPAMLGFRQVQAMDRPEKPVQAVIHRWVPYFPLSASLWVGRLYLKGLLPLLMIFLVLLVPIVLNGLNLAAMDYAWILGSLSLGLGLAWWGYRSSTLQTNAFGQNWLALSWRLTLAAALLLFGIQSGNLSVLLLFGSFGGYLLGTC